MVNFLERQGASPQVLTLLGGVRFIAWCLRRPSLGECRWGPRHFLGLPDVCGLRSCAQTQLKRPCVIIVRLVGRMTNISLISHRLVLTLHITETVCIKKIYLKIRISFTNDYYYQLLEMCLNNFLLLNRKNYSKQYNYYDLIEGFKTVQSFAKYLF